MVVVQYFQDLYQTELSGFVSDRIDKVDEKIMQFSEGDFVQHSSIQTIQPLLFMLATFCSARFLFPTFLLI